MTDPYAELARLQGIYGGASTMRPRTALSLEDLRPAYEQAALAGSVLESGLGGSGLGVAEGGTLLVRLAVLRMSLLQPQTQSEDLPSQQMLAYLRREIDASLRRLGVDLAGQLVLGTLSLPQVDGGTITLGPGADGSARYLLTFDRGLFDVIDRMAKIAARAMQLTEAAVRTAALEETREVLLDAIGRCISLFAAFLVLGRADAAPRLEPDRRYLLVEAGLTSAAELFVVAHEYGHIIEGDVGVHDLASAHEREYRADLWGLAVVLAGDTPFPTSFVAIDMYLGLLSVLQRARPDRYLDQYHPVAADRRDRLRSALRRARTGEISARAAGQQSSSPQAWQALRRAVEQLDRLAATQASVADAHDAALEQAGIIERFLESAWRSLEPVFGAPGAGPADQAAS